MSSGERTFLIAGNWKMNGSLAGSRALVEGLVAGVSGRIGPAAQMLLCPPAPYLAAVKDWVGASGIDVGGQNLCDQVGAGAYTGEISGAMLTDVGCTHVIVGHSERRTLCGEADAVVAAKFVAAQSAGLVPVLCCGETLEERESDRTRDVVERQVSAVIERAGIASFASAVIAYEPVWAIGTGKTATPEQAQEVHAFIRAMIASRDATIAGDLRILYGGSVNGANADELLAMGDIDGGLVGGASLKASEFLKIFDAAAG